MFAKMEALRRFVEVAEAGTVLAAAERLGITQPALTRTIQLLEKDCGAPLFERHPRALKLTAIGQRSLRHAKHILSECRLAETDLQAVVRGDAGQTRISAAPVWMSTILPPVIARFHEQ
ncbi:MAG: LysR family transcriptional regulator, partial [Pseudomonadota bacterium]